jgi:hypothetical protein
MKRRTLIEGLWRIGAAARRQLQDEKASVLTLGHIIRGAVFRLASYAMKRLLWVAIGHAQGQ